MLSLVVYESGVLFFIFDKLKIKAMKDLIQQFEKDLRAHLENTYNASLEGDEVKKINAAEKTVYDFVDHYLLESDLIAVEVELPAQRVLEEFLKSKIK